MKSRFSEISEEKAIDVIKNKVENTSDNKFFSLVGNTLDCESIFSFKLLLDSTGLKNYDCRQDRSFFIPNKRFSYLFNSRISGVDDSDMCILIGTDLRKESPLINARIRQRSRDIPKYDILNFGKIDSSNLNAINVGDDFKSILSLKNEKFTKNSEEIKKASFYNWTRSTFNRSW